MDGEGDGRDSRRSAADRCHWWHRGRNAGNDAVLHRESYARQLCAALLRSRLKGPEAPSRPRHDQGIHGQIAVVFETLKSPWLEARGFLWLTRSHRALISASIPFLRMTNVANASFRSRGGRAVRSCRVRTAALNPQCGI